MMAAKGKWVKVDTEFTDLCDREFPGLSWSERSRLFANPDKHIEIAKKAKKYVNAFLFKRDGSIQDMGYLFVGLMVLCVMIVLGFKLSNEVNTNIQASDIFDAQSKTLAQSQVDTFSGTFDNSILIISIFIGIAMLASAILVRVHPIFIPIFIFLLIIFIVMSAIASNIYSAVEESEQMADVAQQMTITHAIMAYLPIFVGVLGTILMIVMYKTWQNSQ